MWANAVIISDDASVDYSSDSVAVGSTINNNDIVAFYVWIPRFKYRVWNINRQAKGENLTEFDADTYQENYYSYPAFSEGIEIEFETGIRNTGNVECVYDLTTIESVEVLSDKCYYNGEEITVNSNNKNYPNAWYTHPAFTFGDKEILGFWMSKYEVSGEKNEDGLGIQGTIKSIPDAQSLVIQTGSQQFSTAKLFQNYLTSNIDAHMTTSLEWGAVSYLAISKYGLCSDDGCEDVAAQ